VQHINRVKITALLIGATRISNALIAVFTVPIFVKGLGVPMWGLVSLQLTIQVLFSWCEFGLPAAGARELAQRIGDARVRYFSSLDSIMLTLTTCVLLLLLLSLPPIITWWADFKIVEHSVLKHSLLLICIGVVVNLHSVFYANCAIGLSLQTASSMLQLSGSVTRALLGIAAVIWTPDVRLFLASQIVVVVGTNIVMRALICKHLAVSFWRFQMEFGILRLLRKFALLATAINLLQGLAQQLDRLFIARFTGLADLGLYAVAGTAGLPVMMAGSALFTASFADICRLAVNQESTEFEEFFRKTHTLIWILAGYALSVFLSTGDLLLSAWLKEASVNIVHVYDLSAGLCLYWLLFCSNQLYAGVLTAMDRQKPLLKNLTLCLALYIPVLFFCVRKWGVYGAVAVNIVHITLIHLSNLFIVSKIAPGILPSPFSAMKLIICTCTQIAAAFLLRQLSTLTHIPDIYAVVLVIIGIGCVSLGLLGSQNKIKFN